MAPTHGDSYVPTATERIVALVVAVAVVIFVMYLIGRSDPFPDKERVAALKTLLSFAMGVLGAVIPGFLHVSWKGKGFAIRAGGALALFVLTFFGSPHVTDKLSATNLYLERFSKGPVKESLDRINRHLMTIEGLKAARDPVAYRAATETWVREDGRNANDVLLLLRYAHEAHVCIEEGLCVSKQICAAIYDEVDNLLTSFYWYVLMIESSYEPTIQAAKDFRTCDCYEMARKKYCERFGLKEWCVYPSKCPLSLRQSVVALLR